MRALAILAVLAGPVAAQEGIPADWEAALGSCVAGADAETLAGCEGRVADACMQETPGGFSTVGMVDCIGIETALWDRVLNEEWGPLMELMRRRDAAEREDFGDRYSDRAETLLEAQRAWIAFRDAECAFGYALWGSGSIRSLEFAGCQLSMTAQRVARLRDLQDFGE